MARRAAYLQAWLLLPAAVSAGGGGSGGNGTSEAPMIKAAKDALWHPVIPALMFTLIVAITLTLEFFLHNLERWVSNRPHFKRLVAKFYKEVMILGLISLIIFFLVQTSTIGHDSEYFLPMEWVHFLIFATAMIFIFQCLVLLSVIDPIKRSWDRCNLATTEELLQKIHTEQSQMGLKSKISRCRFFCFYSWDLRAFVFHGFTSTQDQVEFKLLRGIFLKMHELPQSFDFVKYSQDSLTDLCIDMVEVGPRSWLLLLALVWVYAVLIPKSDRDSFYWWVTFVPYALLLFTTIGMLWHVEANIGRALKLFGLSTQSAAGMAGSLLAIDKVLEDTLLEEEALSDLMDTDFCPTVDKHEEGLRRKRSSSIQARRHGREGRRGGTDGSALVTLSAGQTVQAPRVTPPLHLPGNSGKAHMFSFRSADVLETGKAALLERSRAGADRRKMSSFSEDGFDANLLAYQEIDLVGLTWAPQIMKACVDSLLVLQNFSMAIYLTQLVWITSEHHTAYFGIPCVFYFTSVFLFTPRLLRAYSLMRGVEQAKVHIIATVVQLTKRTHRVHKDIKDSIDAQIGHLMQLQPGIDKEEATKRVFSEMDDNNDGYISISEFKVKMEDFNIFITRHTFDNVFRILDPDRNGGIDFHEFKRGLSICALDSVSGGSQN